MKNIEVKKTSRYYYLRFIKENVAKVRKKGFSIEIIDNAAFAKVKNLQDASPLEVVEIGVKVGNFFEKYMKLIVKNPDLKKVMVDAIEEDESYFVGEKLILKEDVLQDLEQGQMILHNFQGKESLVEFVEYRDFGFTAVVKDASGREYLAIGNELSLVSCEM